MTVLHGYWRSSAAYRVGIALNLKGVAYQQVAHDLRVRSARPRTPIARADAILFLALPSSRAINGAQIPVTNAA